VGTFGPYETLTHIHLNIYYLKYKYILNLIYSLNLIIIILYTLYIRNECTGLATASSFNNLTSQEREGSSMSITLQLNMCNAKSENGFKFLANIVDRGTCILPQYDSDIVAADKSVTIWVPRVTKNASGNEVNAAEIIEARLEEAKTAGKAYHFTTTDWKVEVTKAYPKGDRKFQSIEFNLPSTAVFSGMLVEKSTPVCGEL